MSLVSQIRPLVFLKQLRCIKLRTHTTGVLGCQMYKRGNHSDVQKPLFKVIPNTVDTGCEKYKSNVGHSQNVEQKYNDRVTLAEAAGGEKAIDRHTQKNKKLLVTERLKMLFDDADDMLELSKLAGLEMPYGSIARASVLVAIGRIQGVYCLVVANDATVKAGTIFPVTVKKQLRAQEIAELNRIPMIHVVDSGGAFLPLQADIFTQGGRAFYNEAILNSKGIPQLAVVCGSCTAGAAYVPTMSQEALIIHKIGTIFLGGPPLVYAALGEVVSPEDLGGATLHSSVSGCTDYFSGTEAEAFETSRDVVATFNIEPLPDSTGYDAPLYDPSELEGIIPHTDQHTMDMYQVIARIVDGSRFHEFKKMYGEHLITGFAFLQGHLVGILGNNGTMTEQAALKGSHFVQMCSQRNIPLIFLQNSTPHKTCIEQLSTGELGPDLGNMTRAHGKLMASVACASNVPKITVIVGNSFGADNFMMCGRSFDPRFVFSWPNAKICMTDPEEATVSMPVDQAVGEAADLVQQLETQSSAFVSTANIWDDGVILPRETRKVLGQCLDIVKQASQVKSQPTEYGVLRM